MCGTGVPREAFDEDYLYFYWEVLSDQRADTDAEVITRLLGLRPGMRVLDMPCGEGRIAGRLSALGCEVVGIDDNERLLQLARARYPSVEFHEGDMRNLDCASEFEAVINWFTSFGYFDPATNDRLLTSLARALRPGGKLLLDVINPLRLGRLVELAGGVTAMVRERDGNLMVDRVSITNEGRSETERVIIRDGQVRRTKYSIELMYPDQLAARLRAAGFGRVELLGSAGAPFEELDARLIALAERVLLG